MSKTKSFSPEAIRIFKLAKRIRELFTDDELRRVASVDPFTIQRWAEEQHVPRHHNALAMAEIIAVKEQSLIDYFNGEIDLDTLWLRRNEAPRLKTAQASDFDDIVLLVKNLRQTDRFRLAMIALESIRPEQLNPDTNPKLILSPQQKTRLKTLLSESMRYQRQTAKGLLQSGADPSLVSDILGDYERDYSEQSYSTLLPFLNQATQWVADDLVVVSPLEQVKSLPELWEILGGQPPSQF